MEAAMRGRNIPDEKIGKFFTQSMLMKKIKGTNKKIEDAEKDAGGTLDALEDAYEKAHKALLKEGEEMKNTLNIHAAMRASYRRRKAKLAEVDAAVETMVSQRFNMYMRKKGHMGRLKLDREEQKLTLLVRIGENTNQAVKDLKQLSGGERSFTTVAFTLALGAETDMPFRAMDEFDVFMDSINRRVAMENLLTFAREHKELQFVFLTPQDMAAVHAARERCTERGVEVPEDFVKIVAMRPARPGAAQA